MKNYTLFETDNKFFNAIGPLWISEDVDAFNVKLQVADNHLRPKLNVVHGSIHSVLCDWAMARTLCIGLVDTTVVSINLNMNFIGPAVLGDVIETDVRVVKGKGKILQAECDLICNDKIIVTSSGVFIQVPISK